ncbi:MAG: hypothetical protein Ct9H300mP1_29320 [Planctomycetaceae bacterium]|nr:MAG: hypothetical protein Ct9H300mP1_29320 [Planctomycetaceae bacterium]
MPAEPTARYLDNHATTRTDPRVGESMLPFFSERFGNAASTGHAFGDEPPPPSRQPVPRWPNFSGPSPSR